MRNRRQGEEAVVKNRWKVGAAVGAILLVAGCAAHAPCPIIPAQLELAEERAKQAKEDAHSAGEELDRIQNNLARIEDNIAKLEEEKAILLGLIGGTEEGGEEE
jgi:septal ring factor EnvC (AmiA/AmiB activator)